MADIKQQDGFIGPLAEEIKEFIEFKRQSGSKYASPESALKAFDRFCAAAENQSMAPQQLAEAWVDPYGDKPKYDGGCCVRQLGLYLAAQGRPNAFIILSEKGNAPRLHGCVNSGPFAEECPKIFAP